MKRAIQIVSAEYAVALYYSKTELGGTDIKNLFGIKNDATVTRFKNQAREVMKERNVLTWDKNSVDTVCAYDAWRIDIARLERMCMKLKKLQLEAVK